MSKSKEKLINQLKGFNWHIEQNESQYSFGSDLHPYFAKFSSRIPQMLIDALSSEGDTVLDPFCGSGTTLVQSLHSGRNSVGVDANPIACLISRVRTNPLSDKEFKTLPDIESAIRVHTEQLYGQSALVETGTISYALPDFLNRDKWFQQNVLNELAVVMSIIRSVNSQRLCEFLEVVFSAILVKVSNQQHESRYSCKNKDIQPLQARNLFLNKMEKNHQILKNMSFHPEAQCSIIEADTRCLDIEQGSIDLLVTSPPYLNAWDYHLYQRFRLFWLGRSPIELKKIEIGAHLRHSYMEKSVNRYVEDMDMCFSRFVPAMKKGSFICMVNGGAVIRGQRINTSDSLLKIAARYNCKLRLRIERPVHGPNYGRKASMGTKGTPKKEDILIFECA